MFQGYSSGDFRGASRRFRRIQAASGEVRRSLQVLKEFHSNFRGVSMPFSAFLEISEALREVPRGCS